MQKKMTVTEITHLFEDKVPQYDYNAQKSKLKPLYKAAEPKAKATGDCLTKRITSTKQSYHYSVKHNGGK
jgi:hypothetical protein